MLVCWCQKTQLAGGTHDLVGLANRGGAVTVGRNEGNALVFDCREVPFLLSRKHATMQFQPDGALLLRDLGSTNGTYVSRHGALLSRLPANKRWKLLDNDTVGFGGPAVILVSGDHVANPFVFKFCGATLVATPGATPGEPVARHTAAAI